MQLFYKIFIALFLIFIGFNLYVMEWQLGFWHEENSKFILSISAAVVGLIVTGILHQMSKLSARTK